MIFILKFLHSKNFSFLVKKVNFHRTRFFFSEEKKQQTNPKKINDDAPPNEILNIDEKLIFNLNEYKQALFYFSNGKYRISQEFYKRVLVYLENNNLKNSDNYVHILKK